MIKTINTGVAELLCVKVPEDARSFKVFNDEMPYLYFHSGHADTHRCYLSSGNYQLLGIAHDLTEEVWCKLLKSTTENAQGDYSGTTFYWDYTDDCFGFDTATESGLSLLRANEIYSYNPYGDTEPEDISDLGAFTQMIRQKHKLWKEAEPNTGKWVMLKKII